jgi:hypothetical protein
MSQPNNNIGNLTDCILSLPTDYSKCNLTTTRQDLYYGGVVPSFAPGGIMTGSYILGALNIDSVGRIMGSISSNSSTSTVYPNGLLSYPPIHIPNVPGYYVPPSDDEEEDEEDENEEDKKEEVVDKTKVKGKVN